MNQKLAWIIFAFAFAVAIFAGFYGPADEVKPSPSDFRARMRETLPTLKSAPEKTTEKSAPGAQSRQPSSVASPIPTASSVDPRQTEGLSEESFGRKYGEAIRFSYAPDHRLLRIDGSRLDSDALEGSNRVPGFRSSSETDLRARADEVFGDLNGLLGLPANTEFSVHSIQPGDSTGKVTYRQSIGGVPIYPGGSVAVTLGAQGEPRALNSSVYHQTRIENRIVLAAPENSRTLLYVTEFSPVALLRYAYETREEGFQVIVDAETGREIARRDQRIK